MANPASVWIPESQVSPYRWNHAGREAEHQLTIRDYLRHSSKYLQATSKDKRSAREKSVEAILPK
jgi:hypothetical protein